MSSKTNKKSKKRKVKKGMMSYGNTQNYGDGMYGGAKDKYGNPKGSN